jgi:hypothetical protein
MMRRLSLVGWLAAAALAGCCGSSAGPAGTGAEAVVRGYYEAILRKDWEQAYGLLHAQSKAKSSAAQFARQAETYRRRLGFEPQQIAVRSCEEHGDEALAHVVLKGVAGAGPQSYKDAIVVRQGASGWGIVLPPRFGQSP